MICSPRPKTDRFGGSPPLKSLLALAALLVMGLAAVPASGLVRFDFEQKYYVHEGRQVWDFCLIRPDSTYHLFYHSIPEINAHATRGDTIWHATSPDLAHWDLKGPVLTAGPEWWPGHRGGQCHSVTTCARRFAATFFDKRMPQTRPVTFPNVLAWPAGYAGGDAH